MFSDIPEKLVISSSKLWRFAEISSLFIFIFALILVFIAFYFYGYKKEKHASKNSILFAGLLATLSFMIFFFCATFFISNNAQDINALGIDDTSPYQEKANSIKSHIIPYKINKYYYDNTYPTIYFKLKRINKERPKEWQKMDYDKKKIKKYKDGNDIQKNKVKEKHKPDVRYLKKLIHRQSKLINYNRPYITRSKFTKPQWYNYL